MSDCGADIARAGRPVTSNNPDFDSKIMESLYEFHLNPPAKDSCAQSRVDALLAATLTAVRDKGGNYTDQVLKSMSHPEVAKLLGNAVVDREGHITFN